MYLGGDTAYDPRLKEGPGHAERDQEREEGRDCRRADQGREGEILYDQIVKHGFIICREIKVSQKKVIGLKVGKSGGPPSGVI